jgi:dienelactone hydrolase
MIRLSAEPTLPFTSALLTEQERQLLLTLLPLWQNFSSSWKNNPSAETRKSLFSTRKKILKLLKPPGFGIRFDELEEFLNEWKNLPDASHQEKNLEELDEACQKGIKVKQNRNQPAEGELFLLNQAIQLKHTNPDAAKLILEVLLEALSPVGPIPCPVFSEQTQEKNEIKIEVVQYQSESYNVRGFLAAPLNQTNLPAVIVGHSGFWGFTPFSLSASISLAQKGFLAFSPEYRGQGLSDGVPEFSGGEVKDTLSAVEYLSGKDILICLNFFFLGEGEGASANFIASCQIKTKGVILLPCILDFMSYWNFLQKSKDRGQTWQIVSLFLFTGSLANQNPEPYRKRSMLQYLDRFQSSLLLLLGDSDAIVSISKIQDLIRELKSFQTAYKLTLYSKTDHIPHLGPHSKDVWESILLFLRCGE